MIRTLTLLLLLLMVSCTKNETKVIQFKDVTFSASDNLKVSRGVKTLSNNEVPDFQPEYPDQYTAYFVADETIGEEITKGELVKTLTVNEGDNTITVPAIKYKVYVTNYTGSGAWYTWPDALQQLPITSNTLYMYGNNTVDYYNEDSGEVIVETPYAAIAILKNEFVMGPPNSYDKNPDDYLLKGGWYYLYTTQNNTNSKVPIDTRASYKFFDLMEPIESNNIYQFTLKGAAPNTTGNLLIDHKEFEKIIEKDINFDM